MAGISMNWEENSWELKRDLLGKVLKAKLVDKLIGTQKLWSFLRLFLYRVLLWLETANLDKNRTEFINSPITFAAATNHYYLCQLLLLLDGNPYCRSADGSKALEYASQNGHLKIVKLLIRSGIKPNGWYCDMRETALYLAVKNGHYEIVKLLIDNGAEISSDRIVFLGERSDPIHMAALKGHIEILDLLIKKGAEINIKTSANFNHIISQGATPLYCALVSKKKEVVELLLKNGAQVNVQNGEGYTPLHAALCWERDISIIKLLIEYGADINYQNSKGDTPLHDAMDNNSKEVVEFLLQNGADPNICNKSYQANVLHTAIEKKRADLIQLLIDYGAKMDGLSYRFPIYSRGALGFKVDKERNKLMSAMELAALERKSVEIVKILLVNGANQYLNDEDGRTILHRLAQFDGYWEDKCQVAQVLIDAGQPVDLQDGDGNTALHNAVEAKNVKLCELLLKNGADVNAWNYNATPLIIACARRKPELVETLLLHGADVTLKTKKGKSSALRIAGRWEHSDDKKNVKLLIAAGAKE
ncbi:ankyrin repeat domain-containing protein [Patescibacteria group bacterium]